MRKGKIAGRLLTIILSAAMVVTSIDGPCLMATAQAGTVSENQIDVTVDQSEDIAAMEAGESAPAEEQNGEDASVGQPDETAEISDALAQDAGEAESELQDAADDALDSVDEEDPVPEGVSIDDGDTITADQIADENLRAALLAMYNEQKSKNESVLTYGLLKQITAIDFTNPSFSTYCSKIKTVSGLGYATGATEINLSALTGLTGDKIADKAFQTQVSGVNSALVKVYLPDTITEIGGEAFYNCAKLTKFQFGTNPANENVLPSTLKTIGGNVFNGCKALTTVDIQVDEIKNGQLMRPAVNMFQGCTGLTTVTIGANVTLLPERIFHSAGVKDDDGVGMTVQFAAGSKLNTIEKKAFEMANMSEVDLTNCQELGDIKERAFAKTEEGKELELVNNKLPVPYIKTVILPAKVTNAAGTLSLGDELFFNTPVEQVYPAGTESPEGKVILPNYVSHLGKGAFYLSDDTYKKQGVAAADLITEVQLSPNLESIGGFMFHNRKKLTNVTIGAGTCKIKTIGDCAFKNTESLADADFVGEMTMLEKIGEHDSGGKYWIEEDCSGDKLDNQPLKYSEYPLAAGGKGCDVFANSGIKSLKLPASLRFIGANSFYEPKDSYTLTQVRWETDSASKGKQYTICEGAFRNNRALSKFEFPETADDPTATFTILNGAFLWCDQLDTFMVTDTTIDTSDKHTHNTLPKSLVKVGEAAFAGCKSLPSIYMTDNLKGEAPEIGENCFGTCWMMTHASLPKSLTKIPNKMFYDSPLKEFPFAASDEKNVITEIGDGAFFGSGMETARLGSLKLLTSIGEFAFAYVDNRPKETVYANNCVADMSKLDAETLEALQKMSYDDLETWLLDPANAEKVEQIKYAYRMGSPLKTVIMPNVTQNVTIGRYAFYHAGKMDTMIVDGKNSGVGTVYIPDYVSNADMKESVFAFTALKKAVWNADTSGSANKWTYIPAGLFAGTEIKVLKDALPANPETTLEQIKKLAFMGCADLKEIDLKPYQNLTEVGNSAFANCMNATKVSLPLNPKYTKIENNCFRTGTYKDGDIEVGYSYAYSMLTDIEIGENVTEIGNSAFAAYTVDGNKEYIYPTALAQVDLSKTNVTIIGSSAFRGNFANLETIKIDGVKELKDSVFGNCWSLKINGSLPDSLEIIGSQSFAGCKSLGKVVFGSGLKTIGSKAFEKCADIHDPTLDKSYKDYEMVVNTGLTAVDFSKAVNLTDIGSGAFAETGLGEFKLAGTKVTKLFADTLAQCPYLGKIELGDDIKHVADKFAYGCVSLTDVVFGSTTIMSEAAFQGEGHYLNKNDGTKYTPVNNVVFKCNPVELVVALSPDGARKTRFPYYVTEYKKGSEKDPIGSLVIGSDTAKPGYYNGNDVETFVKVEATSDYYKKSINNANKIPQGAYYRKLSAAESQEMLFTTDVDKKQVMTFSITGLKATDGNKIPFTITSEVTFNRKDAKDAVTSSIYSEYSLSVEDVPYRVELYTDTNRKLTEAVTTDASGVSVMNKTIRVGKTSNGTITYYYDLMNIGPSPSRPDSCNIVIETSDPDGMAVGGDAKAYNGKYRIEAKPYDSKDIMTSNAATNGKKLMLTPKKPGDYTVKIYPENYPGKSTTLNLKVMADISSIDMAIPDEAKKNPKVGMTFNILTGVNLYLNQKFTVKDNNLNDYKLYTDNVLTFSSDKPDIVSVDNEGNVTIRAITTTVERVTITATVTIPDGTVVLTKPTSQDIKYPTLAPSKTEITAESGETVVVTAAASAKDPEASVTYVKPDSSAKAVVIPDKMTVYGQTCKVTAVDKEAFKDNKTVTSVTIKAGIKELPDNMFSGCKSLTKVTLPSSLEKIGNNVFKGCAKLTTISIPKKVASIGDNAFAGCAKLKTVTINAKGALTSIGKSAFSGCKTLKKIVIPAKVQTIGDKAFYKCAKLKTITVKTKVLTSVGKSALKGIHKKAVITVPKKKKADYVKLFAGKGQAKTVKIK